MTQQAKTKIYCSFEEHVLWHSKYVSAAENGMRRKEWPFAWAAKNGSTATANALPLSRGCPNIDNAPGAASFFMRRSAQYSWSSKPSWFSLPLREEVGYYAEGIILVAIYCF